MKPTKAIYVDWHMPKRDAGKMVPEKRPWEIAMIIRSTHFARKYNDLSPILYCDPDTYSYYDEIGLLKHFDEVKPILPTNANFDTSIFWAAGKFYAILDCEEPFILIDLDAEVRFKIDFGDCDVYCTHLEKAIADDLKFYPNPEYLDRENYIANNFNITWSDQACNTCLLAFNDIDFAKEYASMALKFIDDLYELNPSFSNVSYIVLIEQRFLYDLAKSRGKSINCLISGNYIPTNHSLDLPSFEDSNVDTIADMGFFHVWGFKNDIKRSQDVEDSFLGDLVTGVEDIHDDIINSISMNHKLYIDK